MHIIVWWQIEETTCSSLDYGSLRLLHYLTTLASKHTHIAIGILYTPYAHVKHACAALVISHVCTHTPLEQCVRAYTRLCTHTLSYRVFTYHIHSVLGRHPLVKLTHGRHLFYFHTETTPVERLHWLNYDLSCTSFNNELLHSRFICWQEHLIPKL